MIPENFPEANRTLVWEGPPLRVWTDGEQCVSCWRPTWRERLSLLFGGRVWFASLSGGTQPPVSLSVERTYFKPAPAPEESAVGEVA